MMAEHSKETRRRRRILEQGSDRLAFITGRIQTLPPTHQPQPSSPPPPAEADAPPSSQPQPLISNDQNAALHTTILPHGEAEEKSDSAVLNHDALIDPSHSKPDACISGSQTPSLHKHEPENEISSVPTSQDEHVQPLPDMPPDIFATEQQSQRQQPQTEEPKLLITPSEISSAINASRGTRLCCSVAVALLVVASYLGFSLLGSELIKSVISFRPLYLVLLTNLSVVAAFVLSGKQRGLRGSNRRQNRTSSDGDQWDAQLAKTLELALVMQNTVDAMFIDCAVYAIIVVCGISLMQT